MSIYFLKNPPINSLNEDGTINSPRALAQWHSEIVTYHKFETWTPTFGLNAGTFDGAPQVDKAHLGARGTGDNKYWELRLKFQFKVFSSATTYEVTLTLPNSISTLNDYSGMISFRHSASELFVPGVWFGRGTGVLVFKNADSSFFDFTKTWQVNMTHNFLTT